MNPMALWCICFLSWEFPSVSGSWSFIAAAPWTMRSSLFYWVLCRDVKTVPVSVVAWYSSSSSVSTSSNGSPLLMASSFTAFLNTIECTQSSLYMSMAALGFSVYNLMFLLTGVFGLVILGSVWHAISILRSLSSKKLVYWLLLLNSISEVWIFMD